MTMKWYVVKIWHEVLVGPKMNDTRTEDLDLLIFEAKNESSAKFKANRLSSMYTNANDEDGEPIHREVEFSLQPFSEWLAKEKSRARKLCSTIGIGRPERYAPLDRNTITGH